MIYAIKPKQGIESRRWRADKCGLEYLEKYYSNYDGTGRNRWGDFEVEESESVIHVDFGGGAFTDEPVIEVEVNGVMFSFLSNQARGVYGCVNCDSYKGSGVWRFNGRWGSAVIGSELRGAFLEIADKKVDSWDKQFEDFFKNWKKKVKK